MIRAENSLLQGILQGNLKAEGNALFVGFLITISPLGVCDQIGSTMDEGKNVGYKRPPRQSQFKPGQSGNPSGKAKGLRSMGAELRDILAEEIAFTTDGAIKTMSKQRALASSLITAAIEGDLRATAIVMAHLNRNAPKPETLEEEADFSAVEVYQRRSARKR